MKRPPSAEALQQLIRARRSVRRFRPDPVPQEIIERILETAIWAPSAHNRQPWRFLIVQSQEYRLRLAEVMGAEFRRTLVTEGMAAGEVERLVQRSAHRLLEAPLAVFLCADQSQRDVYEDKNRDRGEEVMTIQSAALAGGWLLLAAAAEGLGGVWICAPLFTPQPIRDVLDLPPKWEPQAMLLLGFAVSIPDGRHRRPISEVVRKY